MLEQKYFINSKTGLMYIEDHDADDKELTESLKYTGCTDNVTEVSKEEYEKVLVSARKKRDEVIAAKSEAYKKSLEKAASKRKAVMDKIAKALSLTEEEVELVVSMPELEKGAGMEISEKL